MWDKLRSHLCFCSLSQIQDPGASRTASHSVPLGLSSADDIRGWVILVVGMAPSWVWWGAGQRKVRTLVTTSNPGDPPRTMAVLPFPSHTNPAWADYNLGPNTRGTLGNAVPTWPS